MGIVSEKMTNPQLINPYSYARNSPLTLVNNDGEFPQTVHRQMTARAFADAGINMRVMHASAIAAQSGQVDVWNAADSRQHFDGMNFSEIMASYQNYVNARDLSDIRGAAEAIHAVQDSYSHSNFIELYLAKNPNATLSSIPTYEQVMNGNDAELKQYIKDNIKTGEFSLSDPWSTAPGTHGEINKDTAQSPRGKFYEFARAAA